MELKGKEVATIVMVLKNAHFDELAEKVIKHFNDLGERVGEVWWTKEDIENDMDHTEDVTCDSVTQTVKEVIGESND